MNRNQIAGLRPVKCQSPTSTTAAIIIACCVLLADFRNAARAAENPARFLAVESWQGDFHHDLSGTYSQTIAGCTTDYTIAQSLSATGVILSNSFNLDNVQYWQNDADKISAQGGVNDQSRHACPNPESTVIDLGYVTGGFTVAIDTNANQYVVSFGGIDLNLVHVGPNGTDKEELAVGWGPPTTNALPSSGLILNGSTTITLDFASLASGVVAPIWAYFSGQMQLVVGWTLAPKLEELEVVIESNDYNDWLPMGDLKDWKKSGDVLYLTARLQTTNGLPPVASQAKNFKFELLQVSSEPGICLNRPHQESADTKSDLRFETQPNQPPLVAIPLQIQNGGMTAVTADGEYLIATAGVSSFDFGAYGQLKVTAEVNGQQIVGYWQKDPAKERKPLLLPRRQSTSLIADKWKEDHNATSLADDDDSEDNPTGDEHPGDGFSLYEEYRGFSENLKHVRLDPERKDFFVLDRMKTADSIQGIVLFAAQTGLNVHSKMRAEEFHAPIGADGELFDTFVNFNQSSATPHKVDQHGIAVQSGSKGYSYAGPDPEVDNRGQGGTPVRYLTVSIDPNFYGWRTVNNLDRSRSVTFVGPANVAHELSHTCAVWHHGEGDEEEVLWQLSGATILENSVEIEPRYENDTTAFLIFLSSTQALSKWIGVTNGQHSGVEDCYMRYIASKAYRKKGGSPVRYLVDETKGITLCKSATGSGVNAAGHSPQSRYGNAARGNCKGQLCVSDVYNGNSRHNR